MMEKMWRRISQAVLFSFLASLLLIGSAQAASSVDGLDLNAKLKTDGSVSITLRLQLTSPGRLSWAVLSNTSDLSVTADGRTVDPKDISVKMGDGKKIVSSLSTSARNWQLSYTTTSTLVRHNNRDQFFFKIFEQPDVSIGSVSATFTLPGVVDQELLAGNAYVIGGVRGAISRVESGSSITYKADSASSGSLMTINASWPSSVLALNKIQEAKLTMSNLDSLPWLVLGVSLPLAALIVLLVLILLQRRQAAVPLGSATERPPADLSPMIVGVLVNKKIYPEEIVALLVDFCRRGYLVIIKKDDNYFFGKRRLPDEHLQLWERNILEQILPAVGTKVSTDEISEINKRTLFSPSVRRAFNEIYEVITQKQYFVENPHLTRIRYKLVALVFYFVSIIGLIWIAISNSTPYLIIPLVGTLVLAWLIIRLTAQLTHYSPNGLAQRSAWLSFGLYLSSDNPMKPEQSRNQTFENYLPYAIALGKTAKWCQRFDLSSSTIVQPDWFVTYDELTASELGDELVKFVTQASKLLTSLRGPLVN